MAQHPVKENTAPLGQIIQKANQQRSMLNSRRRARSRNSPQLEGAQAAQQRQLKGQPGGNRNRFSMSDVSDMLYEFYKANVAKAPKNQQQQQPPPMSAHKYGQSSPASAETHEPCTIAAIATNSAAAGVVVGGGLTVVPTSVPSMHSDEPMASVSNGSNASLHPRIKYTNKSAGEGAFVSVAGLPDASAASTMTAIPTSVLVMPPLSSPQLDVKPLIHPTTGLVISPLVPAAGGPSSVIKTVPAGGVPQAAAIAAALIRDGYHNFQQQLRAQELLKHQGSAPKHSPLQQHVEQEQLPNASSSGNPGIHSTTPTKILEGFLRQHQKRDDAAASDTNDGDDEDDSRYNGFEDIHLVEGSTPKAHFGNSSLPQLFQSAVAGASGSPGGNADYMSDESQKYLMQAQALRNLEYSLGDYGGGASGGSAGSNDRFSPKLGPDGEPVYECCHCGKKYRWKSTLRRHENVECGGKEPGHQCPYCNYRSKQRGNLGVHVRKHHGNMPQLASKRRSKYSQHRESGGGGQSALGSDDSSSKLIIDCSK